MAVSNLVPAASGPTLAEIQTAVSTYSKGPLDVTWTNIGSSQSWNTTSVTFTGLSGYKYLKFVTQGVGNMGSAGAYRITFNSDSGSNYAWAGAVFSSGQYPRGDRSGTGSTSYLYFGTSGSSDGYHDVELNIENANSSAHKHFTWRGTWYEIAHNFGDFRGTYRSTSAISSITLTTTAGTFNNTNPYGFYIYGAN